MDTVAKVKEIFNSHIVPLLKAKKDKKKTFDGNLVWSNNDRSVIWYSSDQVFIHVNKDMVEIVFEGKPIQYTPNTITESIPQKLQTWLETLRERLTQDDLANVDQTICTSQHLLNQYYSTFGMQAVQPQVGASDNGVGFTFKLGNATLLGEAIGETLNFETMDGSLELSGLVGTVTPLAIKYMESQLKK
uniref:Uncharacterized protein n=1 Tax=Clandestinovirus TaxID=2831644 RepID=A0A8F8KP70_9VIRU|nr:hypothetical protein KOM_12_257 [Clandestinovirus]